MFLRFCRRSIIARLDTPAACNGTNVILGMILVLGAVLAVAMAITRLAASF